MTVSRLDELGLNPEVPVRDLLLVGGPAAGGHVTMPEKGTGEFVLHSLPMEIEEYQDELGDWQYHIIGGGGTTDPTTGEPLGSMVYEVGTGEAAVAYFKRCDHNPQSEDADGDLEQVSPYLNHAARATEETVVGDDA